MKGDVHIGWIVIGLLLAFVVLLVVSLFVSGQYESLQTVGTQQDLRNCCVNFRASGCPDSVGTINCKVGDDSKPLTELLDDVGLTVSQLKEFCNCVNV